MTTALATFDALYGVLRVAFLIMAAGLTVVAAIDWMVRTRRLNPFSGTARFFRQHVDPLFVPVERRVIRAGGLPAAAPWWALGVVVVAGIIVLSLIGFLRDVLVSAALASQAGPAGIAKLVIGWVFGILRLAIIVRVISSWFSVSPYSAWVRWSYTLSEPIIRPLRSIIPPLGMIDITPIVAFFALLLLEGVFLSIV